MRFIRILALIAILGFGGGVYADGLEDWSRPPEVHNVKISPTGDYLAVGKAEDAKQVVAVFGFPGMELINVIDLPGASEVGEFWWINDTRLLVNVTAISGSEDRGGFYAVNADGKEGAYLLGSRRLGSRSGHGEATQSNREIVEHHRLLHPRWHNPKEVLVEIRRWLDGLNTDTSAAVLDVYTGALTNPVSTPDPNARVIPDHKGQVQFSVRPGDGQGAAVHRHNLETNVWERVSANRMDVMDIEPLGLNEADKIYLLQSEKGGPRGLYLMHPETLALELRYRNDRVDVSKNVHRDFAGVVYGAHAIPGRYEFSSLDTEHPSAQLVSGLRHTFPDAYPFVTSTTHDFRLSVVVLVQDTRTPEFFLYDATENQLHPLFDTLPWMDDERLAPMQPITVAARDGVELHGYLTVPKGAPPKDLPLVVVPHDGPHGHRDRWGFQWTEGWIPAAGYAMLQINYRGSGGYGQAFENMGHGEWGGKMQDDLTDAVRWAIEAGIADPERVCLFGWGYGGYAALMSVIREPSLYACSVAGAGSYDLDAVDFRAGFEDIDTVIGVDTADRVAASPLTHVERIETPLLLIHGEDDARVPVAQSYELRKAMEKAGKPVPDLIELEGAPHRPRREKNNLRYRREAVAFFDKHIGEGSKPRKPAEENQLDSANR